MVFWGFILAVAGLLTILVSFLTRLSAIINTVGQYGFGGWLDRFFALEFLSGWKIACIMAVVLLIVGVVCMLIGLARAKKTGKQDEKAEKGIKFFRDLKGEFKKITWPTLPAVLRNTSVTLALCLILGLLISLVDLGLGQLIRLLLSLAG